MPYNFETTDNQNDQKLIITTLGDLPPTLKYSKFRTSDQLNHWAVCKIFYVILALEFQSYFQGQQSIIPSMVDDKIGEDKIYVFLSDAQKTFHVKMSAADANGIEVVVKNMLDAYQVIRLGWNFIKDASEIADNEETRIIRDATSPGELFKKILTINCDDLLSVCQGYTEINIREFTNVRYALDKIKRELDLSNQADKSMLMRFKNLTARVHKLTNNFQFKSHDVLNFCVEASSKAKSNQRKDALSLAIRAYKQSSATMNALVKSAGHPRKGRKKQIWNDGVLRKLSSP